MVWGNDRLEVTHKFMLFYFASTTLFSPNDTELAGVLQYSMHLFYRLTEIFISL